MLKYTIKTIPMTVSLILLWYLIFKTLANGFYIKNNMIIYFVITGFATIMWFCGLFRTGAES